ncbi:MAG: toll/interleukin-1 receptor domain-containing protein, partial [Actinobacteria bacterium]|nr:toll/interleukin-1 receptor domain-containing protein [Actinomycetota bacterium]
MGGIFISYRRGDTSPYAGRLSDTLTSRFGPDSIFRDIDGIAPGERFPKVIERAVGSCDAMLALIGRRWLTVKDESRKRRLDDPKDYVRQEISAALRRDDVLVIPVLIEGATMPDAADLPEDLAPLAERNAVRISDGGWKDEVVHLIRALEKVVKDTKPAPPRVDAPSAPPTQPASPQSYRPPPQPYQPSPGPGGPAPGQWQP